MSIVSFVQCSILFIVTTIQARNRLECTDLDWYLFFFIKKSDFNFVVGHAFLWIAYFHLRSHCLSSLSICSFFSHFLFVSISFFFVLSLALILFSLHWICRQIKLLISFVFSYSFFSFLLDSKILCQLVVNFFYRFYTIRSS